MEENIIKIYNEKIKGKYVTRYRKDEKKVYYHGQKMFDIKKTKINLSESVLNIPGSFFADMDIKTHISTLKKEAIPLEEFTKNLKKEILDNCEFYDYKLTSITFNYARIIPKYEICKKRTNEIITVLKSYKNKDELGFYFDAKILDKIINELRKNLGELEKFFKSIEEDCILKKIKTDEGFLYYFNNEENIPKMQAQKIKLCIDKYNGDNLKQDVINKLLKFEYDLLKVTVAKIPYKKLSYNKAITIKADCLNEEYLTKFDKLLDSLKIGIDKYNASDNISDINEKIFQDSMMTTMGIDKINKKLNYNLIPLEEEFKITIPTDLAEKFYTPKEIMANTNEEELNNDSKENKKNKSGRIDNVYILDKRIVLAELKMNEGAITNAHGIASHLKDLWLWLKDENKYRSLEIEKLKEAVNIRNKYFREKISLDSKENNLVSKYLIFCGYDSKIAKGKILAKIKEEKEEILKYIEYINENAAFKIDTEIYLVKVNKILNNKNEYSTFNYEITNEITKINILKEIWVVENNLISNSIEK